MKRSELFFDAILLPIDFIALLSAAAVAYVLRTSSYVQQWRPAVFVIDLPFIEYMQLAAMVACGIVVIFSLQGLYAMQVTRRLLDEVTRIFAGISMGMMGVIVFIFLSAELFQSRFILLAAYFIAVFFTTLARYFVHRLQRWSSQRGYGVYRVLLVGNGKLGERIVNHFAQAPELGYRVVGKIDVVRWDVLEEIYRNQGIDEVIKLDPTLPEDDNLVLLDFCEQYKIGYKYVPDLFETYAPNWRFSQIGSVPLMELMRTPLEGWGRVAKRVLDVIGSVLGLLFLAPVFVIVAVLIKTDTKGPVFYRQKRVGKNMLIFEMVKFRSMKTEYCTGERYGGDKAKEFEDNLRHQLNERQGPLFKMKNDPRVTRVGACLRRSRIDELPQLFNVLVGEMSLVGPRPHLPSEVQRYDKHHRKLFTIKPGMTGMGQISGSAGLPFEQESKLDIGYIEDWSLKLDFVILIKTLAILFTDKNAV